MTSRELVGRYLREIVSAGNLEVADEIVAEDLVFVSPYTPEPTRDRAGFKAMIAGLHAAFPDFSLVEEAVIAEGDLVASRWTASGTHTGTTFAGLSPSGRRFSIAGMSIYEVSGGRISRGWVVDDTLGMAVQLGLVRLPAPVT